MITSVKEQSGDLWLVNGSMSVSKNDPRGYAKRVLAYIEAGGVVEPEFTDAELEDQRVEAIRTETRRRCFEVMDAEQQRNSTVETLALKEVPVDERTQELIALYELHKDNWGKIDKIRTVGRAARADGTALGGIVWPI